MNKINMSMSPIFPKDGNVKINVLKIVRSFLAFYIRRKVLPRRNILRIEVCLPTPATPVHCKNIERKVSIIMKKSN